jgi:hypothetical protein
MSSSGGRAGPAGVPPSGGHHGRRLQAGWILPQRGSIRQPRAPALGKRNPDAVSPNGAQFHAESIPLSLGIAPRWGLAESRSFPSEGWRPGLICDSLSGKGKRRRWPANPQHSTPATSSGRGRLHDGCRPKFIVGQLFRIVAVRIARRCPGPTCVFPLCFGRQCDLPVRGQAPGSVLLKISCRAKS